jgi:acyl-CoA thioesterase
MIFSDVMGGAFSSGVWSTEVSEDWMQGRSVFGGLQSALALRAMRSVVAAEVPLRVLQTTFVAPVPAGTFAVEPRILRTGKSVTQVQATLAVGREIAAVFVGVFGSARASRVSVVPSVPRLPREDLPITPKAELPRPPRAVAFAEHFSMRWLRGDLPVSGSTRTDAIIEVGMRDRATTASEEHVVAIADSIPPLALSFLDVPAPGSSVTWTLELLRSRADNLPLEGWRLDAELTAAGEGYTSQSVVVSTPAGAPFALSRQSMVIFG